MGTGIFARLVAAAGVALCGFAGAVQADEVLNTLVYIECANEDRSVVSRGSGVLISANGRVLTVGFVVPEEHQQNCRGSIGVADPQDTKRLIPEPDSSFNAVRVLRFQTGRFDYARVCDLDFDAVRRPIFAAGFPRGSRTGVASYRVGILSTITPDDRGVIESDVMTTAGMEGGPIFSENFNGIVGLIEGANINSLGMVESFNIRPLADLARLLNLEPSPTPCFTSLTDQNTERLAELERRIGELEDALEALQ